VAVNTPHSYQDQYKSSSKLIGLRTPLGLGTISLLLGAASIPLQLLELDYIRDPDTYSGVMAETIGIKVKAAVSSEAVVSFMFGLRKQALTKFNRKRGDEGPHIFKQYRAGQ
jgi:hypothetical protein